MVGILCSRIRLEEKLLFENLRKRRIEFEILDPRLMVLNGKKSWKHFDLVLNREISQMRAELVLEYLNNQGIRTINSVQVTRVCNNKALCTWELEKYQISMPKTVVVFSKEEAIREAKKIGYPVVAKPIIGSWGRLLAKINNRETLEAILEHKEALASPYHSFFYLQEYVEKPERDIRILVINKEPVAGMYRQSKHWITNTAKGATPRKLKLNSELISLTQKIVEKLNIEIAGIDIVETKSGYQVLEINSTVEFHGLQTVSGTNIAEKMVDYVISEALE
jgi:[lysine-biosynthesis-protein LysW]--L-2-aminoadipate ligase